MANAFYCLGLLLFVGFAFDGYIVQLGLVCVNALSAVVLLIVVFVCLLFVYLPGCLIVFIFFVELYIIKHVVYGTLLICYKVGLFGFGFV